MVTKKNIVSPSSVHAKRNETIEKRRKKKKSWKNKKLQPRREKETFVTHKSWKIAFSLSQIIEHLSLGGRETKSKKRKRKKKKHQANANVTFSIQQIIISFLLVVFFHFIYRLVKMKIYINSIFTWTHICDSSESETWCRKK